MDAETVVALREFAGDGHRRNAELVEYTPDGEAVLAGGAALLGARVEATADGFVTGLRLVRAALGFFGGQELQLDLAEFGFNRADLFAVDSSGTRIAFTADSLITAGLDRGLQRWQVVGDRLRSLHPASFPRHPRRRRPLPAVGRRPERPRPHRSSRRTVTRTRPVTPRFAHVYYQPRRHPHRCPRPDIMLLPVAFTDRGLDAALSAVAARSPTPVTVDVEVRLRRSAAVEGTAYLVVTEAPADVGKRSAATSVKVGPGASPYPW
ncbi:hypothetical protein ACFWNL_27395 [Kitasatospora sp. NPDC058397]|uniref:hypothetical protein n=1 Tax=unclassified Kitasatospora TaxID=2633591 RepID=UPI003655FD1E